MARFGLVWLVRIKTRPSKKKNKGEVKEDEGVCDCSSTLTHRKI